jgi:hypothetical protein
MRDQIRLMVHESFINLCEGTREDEVGRRSANPVEAKRMIGLSGKSKRGNPLATAAAIAAMGAAGAFGVDQIIKGIEARERENSPEVKAAEEKLKNIENAPRRRLGFQ